jgi:hypothetical protein
MVFPHMLFFSVISFHQLYLWWCLLKYSYFFGLFNIFQDMSMWLWVKTLYPFCSHQNSWDWWMFIPLKMVLIGIDPSPCIFNKPIMMPWQWAALRCCCWAATCNRSLGLHVWQRVWQLGRSQRARPKA